MEDNNGVRIALSPVQLAAILSDKSVSEGETMSNRLWGGVDLLGGVIEMFGAGVMCIAPEPTSLTKIGCVIVGTHSLDTMQAASQQIWTGRQTNTETFNSAVALAETLGADHNTAVQIGMAVDLSIPMGFAIAVSAVRVSAVRGGRLKLAEHESATGKHPGGHTLERHIGKTPEELSARLERRPSLPATSSFNSLKDAERFTSQTLRAHKYEIEMWVKHAPRVRPWRKQVTHQFAEKTGIVVKQGSTRTINSYRVTVSLELTEYNGKPYFILTSFPVD